MGIHCFLTGFNFVIFLLDGCKALKDFSCPYLTVFLFSPFFFFFSLSSHFSHLQILSGDLIGGNKSGKGDLYLEELLHLLIFFPISSWEKGGREAEKESNREGERGGEMKALRKTLAIWVLPPIRNEGGVPSPLFWVREAKSRRISRGNFWVQFFEWESKW